MKKLLCLSLCLLLMSPALISCSVFCSHEYSDGVCTKCDKVCSHTFENGKCSVCSKPCTHTFENSVCTVCNQECSHAFENGVCAVCNSECSHTFEKGMCDNCGMINITKKDLANRKFEYSYFEIEWSELAIEKDKENLRKNFNADNDEQLFDKIHDRLLLGFGPKPTNIDGVRFTTYGVVSRCIEGEWKGAETNIVDNMIVTIDDKNNELVFHYEKDKLYTILNLDDYRALVIKLVYQEV